MAIFSRGLSSLLVSLSISLPFAGACLADATPPAPVPIATGGQANSVSINALGEVVWTQWDSGTGTSQVFSSWRGQLTSSQTGHSFPAINNRGDVVWLGSDPDLGYITNIEGIIDGKAVIIARDVSTPKVAINDNGEVVWSESDAWGMNHLYTNQRGQLTSGRQNILRASINNLGVIAFTQVDEQLNNNQIFTLASAGQTPVEVPPAGNPRNDVAINDSGELVWTDNVPVGSIATITSSTRGLLVGPANVTSIALNNCGDLVYTATSSDGSTAYQLGNNAPCATYSADHSTLQQAVAMTLGSTVTGVADSATVPVGWYRFDAGAGDTIKVGVNSDSSAGNLISIGLYDGQGNLLTPATSQTPAGIRTLAPYAGSYYVKVEAQGGRFGYGITVNSYPANCNAGVCAELVASGDLGKGVSINALGEAVWTQFEPISRRYQVVSSQRDRLTNEMSDHQGPVINNLGDVVWTEFDSFTNNDSYLFGLIGGIRVTVGFSTTAVNKMAINDRRESVWSVYDYLTSSNQIFSSVRNQLTPDGPLDALSPSLDNQGTLTYLQRDPTAATAQAMKLPSGGAPSALTSDNAPRVELAANQAGEIVWTEQDPAGGGRIVSNLRGVLMGVKADSVGINDCGDVIYSTVGPDGPAVYRIGNAAPCSSLPAGQSLSQATPVAFGDIFTGQVDIGADAASWYRFDAKAGDTIHALLNFDQNYPNDVEMTLFDGNGNKVIGMTSFYPPFITAPAPYTGSYYLKVQALNGKFGFTVSLSKYSSNCGAEVCPDQVTGDPGNAQLWIGSSLNSLGEAVWTQFDPVSSYFQVFSSQRGQLTFDQNHHYAPSINDVGDLVWGVLDTTLTPPAYVLHGTVGGQPFTLATGDSAMVYQTDINNNGEVVWCQGANIISSRRGALIGPTVNGQVGGSGRLNDKGDLVFVARGSSNTTDQVYKLAAGSSTPVAITDDSNYHQDAAVNDADEIVWSQAPNGNLATVYSSTRGGLVFTGGFTGAGDVDINNCGDVLYNSGNALYRFGNNAPCVSYPGSHDTMLGAAAVTTSGTFTAVADSGEIPVSWYRFDASAGDTLHLTVNYNSGASNAISIALYDWQGNLVASPDAASPGKIDYPATITGSYYLKVTGLSGRVGYAVTSRRDSALFKLSADGQQDAYFATLTQLFSQAPVVSAFRLFCQSGDFAEDVNVNLCGETVTMSGGYDPSYSAQSGRSRIDGTLRVKCGKLVADGVAIR